MVSHALHLFGIHLQVSGAQSTQDSRRDTYARNGSHSGHTLEFFLLLLEGPRLQVRIWLNVIVESVRLQPHQNCEAPITHRSAEAVHPQYRFGMFV